MDLWKSIGGQRMFLRDMKRNSEWYEAGQGRFLRFFVWASGGSHRMREPR